MSHVKVHRDETHVPPWRVQLDDGRTAEDFDTQPEASAYAQRLTHPATPAFVARQGEGSEW